MTLFAKTSIATIGLISAGFGGIFFASGIYLKFYAPKEYKLLGDDVTSYIATTAISIGIWLFATGMLGAGAVVRGDMTSMMMFAGTTALVSASLIALSILMSMYHEYSQYYISFMINKTIQTYGKVKINTDFVDYMHRAFNCCGITEMHREWEHIFNRSQVPDSCCLEVNVTNCGKNNRVVWFSRLYNDPCPIMIYEYLYKQYKSVLIIIYGISLSFTFITALTATNARTISVENLMHKSLKNE